MMMLIKAIVRPGKIDDIKNMLDMLNLPGMTVIEVRGHGRRQKSLTTTYRGQEYDVSLLPKSMIEIVVEDDHLERVVDALMTTARTGEIGDGRIFVLPVQRSYNIRTGEKDVL
jgi:nitrogen regulatory protein PII